MTDIKCCTVSCDNTLNQDYWDNQYKANTTGWDLGQLSPPIKIIIDSIQNKEARILIPGCGNTYEAIYLLEQGFNNITVIDIAPTLVNNLKIKFANNNAITVLLGDFFEHQGSYDYIIEQTFFCALPPRLRQKYVWKMHQLLAENGKLTGLFFNRIFESGPPFAGCLEEYEQLFKEAFMFNTLATSPHSIAARANSELYFEFQKNNQYQVNIYLFEGITCKGCMETVYSKLFEINNVLNASMNADFSEIIIVSKTEIELSHLQKIISYDQKYKIVKFK